MDAMWEPCDSSEISDYEEDWRSICSSVAMPRPILLEDILGLGMYWPFEDYVDIRSSQKACDRVRKQHQKYYGYRGVKPSWIGQNYYDLVVVSETTCTWKKSRKRKSFCPATVIEHEHPNYINDPRNMRSLMWLTFPSIVDLAIAHARSNKDFKREDHKHENITPQYEDVQTIDVPSDIEQLLLTKKADEDFILKLKTCTWTKADNFEEKGHFINGPDRRHHRGKRKVRERHLQKMNEHSLERDTRSRHRWLEEQYCSFYAADLGSYNLEDSAKGGDCDSEEDVSDVVEATASDADTSPTPRQEFSIRYVKSIRRRGVPIYTPATSDIGADDSLWLMVSMSLSSGNTIFSRGDDEDGESYTTDKLSSLGEDFLETNWDLLGSEDHWM